MNAKVNLTFSLPNGYSGENSYNLLKIIFSSLCLKKLSLYLTLTAKSEYLLGLLIFIILVGSTSALPNKDLSLHSSIVF